MFYEAIIALRHLAPKKKGGILSFATLLATGGVAVGVGVLIIVLAVMNGFERDLREKILGLQAHLFLLPEGGEIQEYSKIIERMDLVDGIVACAPFIHTQAILIVGDNVRGVVFKGVDPQLENKVTKMQSYLIMGCGDLREDEIILGSELARYLGVGVGGSVRAILSGAESPVMKTFKVSGIFKSGMYDYDSLLVYSNLKCLQRILWKKDMVSGISAKVRDIYHVEEVKRRVEELFRRKYWVRTWIEMNQSLFAALKLEKTVTFIILALIILIAGLGIANSLVLTVMQKRKEIGILLSLGTTRWGIGRVFLLEGLLIGISGIVIGLLLGLLGCEALSRYQFVKIPQEIYYISYLPVDVRLGDVMAIILCTLILSLCATIYPALRASRLHPIEVIRYE